MLWRLFGSFFLAYASLKSGLESTLLFDQLVKDAPKLSPQWLHAAFVLLFVGYGTKMGLAPMHTWKPDAYGEAPGIVGTLLAGGVTSCAFLAILRIYQICRAGTEAEFAREIMIFIGLLSMVVAAVFMARQKDFKRLLAYSSIEHMGILVLGLGIGGVAIYGALLHLINNGLTKGVLFLSAGNIHRAYGSKLTDDVRGAIQRLPLSGALFLAGFLAITGSPPFGPFVSEFTIVNAAVGSGQFCRQWLVLAPSGSGLRRHGSHGSGRSSRRRPCATRNQTASATALAPAHHPAVHGAGAAAGPLHPASLGVALARRRGIPGGEAMNHNGFDHRADGAANPTRTDGTTCRWRTFAGRSSTRSAAGSESLLCSAMLRTTSDNVDLYVVLADAARCAIAGRQNNARIGSLSLADAGLSSGAPVRARNRRTIRRASRQDILGSSRFVFTRRIARVTMRGAGSRTRSRSSASPTSTVSRARKSTKSPSDRSTPASSNRDIFAFSAMANTYFIWRFRSATSIEERSGRSLGGPDKRTIHTMETVAGDTSIGHATAYCQAVEGLAGCQVPDPGRRAARRRSRTGTTGEPHGRSWRTGRRRGVPADRCLLRPHSRRLSRT